MSRPVMTASAAMDRALELARRGIGAVEPNPPVGAVILSPAGELVGEGWHQKFGGPHAEVFALEQAGEAAQGGTLYCTLEPCCHFGKTPPCSRAVIAAGVKKVVIAQQDPFSLVNGGGIAELRAAGIEVEVGLGQESATWLTAPFFKLATTGRPWVHAKWAMTLDGKIAARTGHSQWISGESSRAVVHELRGRMDAIVVGIGTAYADDPLLTARPAGPRLATRVVVDANARLPLDSQLVRTAGEAPVLCIVADNADFQRVQHLQERGVEILAMPRLVNGHFACDGWLTEMGYRRWTNILVEGGSELWGSLFDANAIDEVHAFIAPKLVGGKGAPGPLGGRGLPAIPEHLLHNVQIQQIGNDVYMHGYCSSRLQPTSPSLPE